MKQRALARFGMVWVCAVVVMMPGFGTRLLSQSPTSGTGTIRGRVLDGVTKKPIKGAIVTIDGDVAVKKPGILTGTDGSFVFKDLLVGMFALTASRPGYFNGEQGQRRPGGSRAPLALGDGETRDNVTLLLWQHGTISGTVTGEGDRALPGVTVRIVRLAPGNGAFGTAAAMSDTTVMTDDEGNYTIPELLPGRYVVGVVPQYGTRDMVAAAEAAARSGRGFPTPQDVSALDAQGRFGMTIYGVPVLPPLSSGRPQLYPATFASSSRTSSDAAIVQLGPSEAREHVDIALHAVPGAGLAGRVIGPAGPESGVLLRLIPSSSDRQWITGTTTTGADGTFLFAMVPAGTYIVEATRNKPGTNPRNADPDGMAASVPVTIDGSANQLTISLRAGYSVSGRLTIEGVMPAADRGRLQAYLDPIAEPGAAGIMPGVPKIDVTDGFMLTGVPPGRYLAGVTALPAGWRVKSAYTGGRNAALAPIDIGASDVVDLEFVLTQQQTWIGGAVRDARGAATDIASVVIFPADRTLWVNGTRGEHQVLLRRAAGAYEFENLPAGEYFVAALDDAALADWPSIDLLTSLAGRATRVPLADGERKTVNLVVR